MCLRILIICLSISVLVVSIYLSVLTKSLARNTPLRTPINGEEIISTKPRQESEQENGQENVCVIFVHFAVFVTMRIPCGPTHTYCSWHFVAKTAVNTDRPTFSFSKSVSYVHISRNGQFHN